MRSLTPSIILAFAPASRLAISSFISSIDRSSCSSVISLIALLCSTLRSRGTSSARLYGVTMAERGVSQLVSVDLEGAVKLREAV